METKLSFVAAAMAQNDWPQAIKLAAKFQRLGSEKNDIMRAHEALVRPEFQRQLGRDIDVLIEAGKAALLRRYPID
jgi:hypothetical protein